MQYNNDEHIRRQDRQFEAIFADYGQDKYNEDLIQPVLPPLPSLGDGVYVQEPILLCKIAAAIAVHFPIQAVDCFYDPLAVGWTTGTTTILIKLTDLKRSILIYEGQNLVPSPIKIAQANCIGNKVWRDQFDRNWPNMPEAAAMVNFLYGRNRND